MNFSDIASLPASRETDLILAERLMGWPVMGQNDQYRSYRSFGGVIAPRRVGRDVLLVPEAFRSDLVPETWRPTARIEDAFRLVPRDGYFLLESPAGLEFAAKIPRPWSCRINYEPTSMVAYGAIADTAPLAISRAALMASFKIREAIDTVESDDE